MTTMRATSVALALSMTALAGCGGTDNGAVGGGADSGGVNPEAGADTAAPPPPADSGAHPGDAGADTSSAPPDGSPPSDSGQPAEAGQDSSIDASDHGAPSSTYPAFTPDVAQVVGNGGPVLATPNVVTVSWSNDPNKATFDAFGDTIGPSTYWHAINSEYGVGPSTSGNHVHVMTAPPASMSDSQLAQFVQMNAGSATSGWPAPTPQTLYAVYVSPSTAVTLGGQDACQQGIGGYHDEVTGVGQRIVYAIILQCQGLTDTTITASHELNEAATDPHPFSNTAYAGFDPNHLSFEFFNAFQDELGDACESFRSSQYTETEPTFTYSVQRQWSNASAKAGHTWCVPALAEPFYNTTLFPDQETTINVNLTPAFGSMGGVVQTMGFKTQVNQPVTFQVGYFSDVATSGPWALDAVIDAQLSFPDQNNNPINNGTGTVTIDKTTGVNGEKAYVTVTPTAFDSLNVFFFYLRSQLTGTQAHHYTPVLISSM